MNAKMARRPRFWTYAFVAAVAALFLAAGPAEAQIGVRPKGKRGRSKRGTIPQRPKARTWSEFGSHATQILSFSPPKAGEEDEFVGILKLKPLQEGAKVAKVWVRREGELVISLESHTFTAEEFAEMPLKGLFCTASWGLSEAADETDDETKTDKKKKKRKELKSLSFENIEVKGTIEQIEDDLVILRARPKNDRQWPDYKARIGAETKGGKPKRVRRKKLKLKIFDDVTKFVDGDQEPLDLGDFNVDQEIEATVVFGKKIGIMIHLRAPNLRSESEEDEDDQPRPGRGRGRRPGPRP